jgi:hypothetical protein
MTLLSDSTLPFLVFLGPVILGAVVALLWSPESERSREIARTEPTFSGKPTSYAKDPKEPTIA